VRSDKQSERQVTPEKTSRIGQRLIDILRMRVALCDEMVQQKVPLACYTRDVMRRLSEVENLLDELVMETVADILAERRDT